MTPLNIPTFVLLVATLLQAAKATQTTQTLQSSLERRAQGAPGTPCEGTGPESRCAYVSADDGETVVYAYCSPSGFCGDNGAYCAEQADCYNFCGTDQTCGGAGAYCSSRSTEQRDEDEATCYAPTYRCSTDAPGGRCVLNPSARPQAQPGSGSDIGVERRRGLQELSDRRKRHSINKAGIMDRLRRASEAVARPGDEVLDL